MSDAPRRKTMRDEYKVPLPHLNTHGAAALVAKMVQDVLTDLKFRGADLTTVKLTGEAEPPMRGEGGPQFVVHITALEAQR